MEPVETPLDRAGVVNQFWSAHEEALFPQGTLTLVTDLSHAFFERGRWAGYGPRFLKIGRSVRYRKGDVIAWLEKRQPVSSTTEAAGKVATQFDPARGPRKKARAGPNSRVSKA